MLLSNIYNNIPHLTNNYKTSTLLLIRQFRREHNQRRDSLRNRKGDKKKRSVKVRDLPGDKSRNITAMIRNSELTAAEEAVFRARRGISLAPGERLDFRGQDNDLTRYRLRAIEARVFNFRRRGRGHRG